MVYNPIPSQAERALQATDEVNVVYTELDVDPQVSSSGFPDFCIHKFFEHCTGPSPMDWCQFTQRARACFSRPALLLIAKHSAPDRAHMTWHRWSPMSKSMQLLMLKGWKWVDLGSYKEFWYIYIYSWIWIACKSLYHNLGVNWIQVKVLVPGHDGYDRLGLRSCPN